MYGWNLKLLRVNLTKGKAVAQEYDPNLAKNFLGERGFAVKIVWDELNPGVNALSSDNKLIFATGPLTGLNLPSSGKLVVAARARARYDSMLQAYYDRGGWDKRGIPTKKTLTKLGLEAVAHELSKRVELTD